MKTIIGALALSLALGSLGCPPRPPESPDPEDPGRGPWAAECEDADSTDRGEPLPAPSKSDGDRGGDKQQPAKAATCR